MAFVTIRIKGVEGYARTSLDKDRLVVGRASAAGIPIKHTSISREHFALIREGTASSASATGACATGASATGATSTDDKWLVEDLGSANGTRINDSLLTGRVLLKEKDIVKAGQARLTFHVGSLADAEAAIELNSDDDGAGAAPSGPQRKAGLDDPPEAITCGDCQGWFSIAHRMSGESMSCPHCGKAQIVPELVA